MSAAAAPAMTKGNAWRMAIRLPTLTASVAPVLVGTGAAIRDDAFDWLPALAALLGAILLQIGANFANDVYDFKRGADTADRLGPPRATQMGALSPKQVFAGMWTVFGLAFLIGVYLVYVGGWPIVLLGLGSILGAIIYTGGPWPIGYHALGDLFTFGFFGPVAVVGTYYVQADGVTWLPYLASIPMGCTVTMILIVNNLRDIPTDSRTGKTTLGVLMGDAWTRRWYLFHLGVSWAVPLALAATGEVPLGVVAVLVSGWWAWPLVKAIRGGVTGRALNPVLKATARFNLVVGVAWALALAITF